MTADLWADDPLHDERSERDEASNDGWGRDDWWLGHGTERPERYEL